MNLDLARILGMAVTSIIYAVAGLVTFLVFFFLVDRLTPGNLCQELVEKRKTAVGVFFGLMALGLSIIIAACLHG